MFGSLIMFVAALAATPPAQSLEALGWMSGSWMTPAEPMRAGDPHWREEIWSRADRSSMMVGNGRGQRGFGRFTCDYLRIEEEEGVITLHLQEMTSPVALYRLVGSSANEAIFEGAATNVPQRIVYRREGDALAITGSRLDGGAAYAREYRRRTDRLPPAD